MPGSPEFPVPVYPLPPRLPLTPPNFIECAELKNMVSLS